MASPFLVLCSQSFLWLTYASAHAANGGVLEATISAHGSFDHHVGANLNVEATISAHGSFDHHVGANLNVEATDPKSSLTGASYGEAVVKAIKQRPSVLMVLTSNDKPLGGWYLSEASHPFYVFKKAGVQMTWASPKGGKAPVDKGPLQERDKEDTAFLQEQAWKHTKPLKDVDPADFDAVFVAGGYGVMWDLVSDDHLHKIAAKVYEDGGIVSGVCHGAGALAGVKLSDGKSLVKGKEVTCFSNAEEDASKSRDVVPETCEDSFTHAGAKYTKGKPWSVHVSVSGRLITGQNMMSAKSTAEAVVKALSRDKVEEEKFQIGKVEATEVSHDAAKRNHVVRRESEGEKQGGFAEATHHAKYASAAVNASTVTEIHLIGDDVVVAQDHVCGGAGAHEVERYPGPTERTLLECRQACMDDKNCYYYAYWPEGNGQKNTDGECKNNCRLYDRCSDHSSNHEQIDTVSCRAFLFKIGPTTETQRPAYARHHKASIQSSARDPRQAFSLAFTIAAALASISQC